MKLASLVTSSKFSRVPFGMLGAGAAPGVTNDFALLIDDGGAICSIGCEVLGDFGPSRPGRVLPEVAKVVGDALPSPFWPKTLLKRRLNVLRKVGRSFVNSDPVWPAAP